MFTARYELHLLQNNFSLERDQQITKSPHLPANSLLFKPKYCHTVSDSVSQCPSL